MASSSSSWEMADIGDDQATTSPTKTADSPRPTSDSLPVNSTAWQPYAVELNLVESAPSVAVACLQGATTAYRMDMYNEYALHLLLTGANMAVSGVDLRGVYYSNLGGSVAGTSIAGYFNGEMFGPTKWTLSDLQSCASFELSMRPTHSTIGHVPGSNDGVLSFQPVQEAQGIPVTILITRAVALVQTGSTPNTGPATSSGDSAPSTDMQEQATAPSPDSEAQSSPFPASSSSGPTASVLVPAILVPILVLLLAAIAGFFLWRRRRRSRMAPSAAFRADHADAVQAMECNGSPVGLGVPGAARHYAAVGSSSPMQQSAPYFPLDEKRPLSP